MYLDTERAKPCTFVDRGSISFVSSLFTFKLIDYHLSRQVGAILEIVHNKVVNEPEAVSADHVLKVNILYCTALYYSRGYVEAEEWKPKAFHACVPSISIVSNLAMII